LYFYPRQLIPTSLHKKPKCDPKYFQDPVLVERRELYTTSSAYHTKSPLPFSPPPVSLCNSGRLTAWTVLSGSPLLDFRLRRQCFPAHLAFWWFQFILSGFLCRSCLSYLLILEDTSDNLTILRCAVISVATYQATCGHVLYILGGNPAMSTLVCHIEPGCKPVRVGGH